MANAVYPPVHVHEDVFGEGISRIQDWGEEEEEGVLYQVRLKRNRYLSCDSSTPAHLHYETTKVRTVRAGTLQGLVGCLSPSNGTVEPSFLNVFLRTHLTFTTAGGLVEAIIARHTQCQEPSKDDDEHLALVATAQKNLASFIRLWLDHFSDGLMEPPEFKALKSLTTFIEEHMSHDPGLISLARKVLEGFESQGTGSTSIGNGIGTLVEEFGVFSLSPQQIAENLTFLAARVFQLVRPHECIKFLSAKKNKESQAPTVWATIEQFNRLTCLVITTVLRASVSNFMEEEGHTPQIRAKVIEQWITACAHCRRLKNFTSTKAIVSGLQAQPIHRLHRTWTYVSSEYLESFQELQALMTIDNNSETSRNLLQREGTAKHMEQSAGEEKKKGKERQQSSGGILGVVAHLGTFLQDLTYLDAAFRDTTDNGMINFEKRRKYFEAFAQIQLFQKSAANYPATYTPDQSFEAWLNLTPLLTERESYDLSEALECDTSFSSSSSEMTLSLDSALKGSGTLRKKLANLLHPGKSPMEQYSPSRTMSNSMGQNTPTLEEDPIIRVSMDTQDQCNYKSIRLLKTDTTQSIVQAALDKYGLDGAGAGEFNLYQVLIDRRRLLIPEGSAVYFAMASGEPVFNFVLQPSATAAAAGDKSGGHSLLSPHNA